MRLLGTWRFSSSKHLWGHCYVSGNVLGPEDAKAVCLQEAELIEEWYEQYIRDSMAAQMTGALLWGRAAFRGKWHSLILEEGKYFPSGWWGWWWEKAFEA